MKYQVQEKKVNLRNLNILVPVDTSQRAEQLLPLALSLLGKRKDSCVNLIGITPVSPSNSLSEGALLAQKLRNHLRIITDEDAQIRHLSGSLVSHQPWDDIEDLIEERMEDEDLLLLP